MSSIPNYYGSGSNRNDEIEKLKIKKLFRGIILGPSGSGKNNLVMHILKNSPNTFSYLHIIARNPDQPLYDYIREKIPNFVSFYDAESIPPLDQIRKNPINEGIELVIIDDFSNDPLLQKRVFSHFFTRGRHFKLSTLFLSHSYFATDKMIRLNSCYLMILKANSKRDLKMVVKDFNIEGIDDQKMFEAYKRGTQDRGQMLFVDSLKSQLRYNFDRVINPSEL